MRSTYEMLAAAFAVVVLSLILTSCGPALLGSGEPTPLEFSLEGVKLIAQDIPNGR